MSTIKSLNSSPSLITIERQHLTGTTLTSPPPILSYDLIFEILCRLPVKVLLRFLCVCKSWKSLISEDYTFTKKRLSHTTTGYSLHSFQKERSYSHRYINLKSYSFDSLINNVITTNISKLHCDWNGSYVYFVGSCNGILCIADRSEGSILIQLWNPSIRKFKQLPRLLEPEQLSIYGFGYDPIHNNYKVVILPVYFNGNVVQNNKGKIHTLGTNSWKTIPMFPFVGVIVQASGQYVSGTINWLAFKSNNTNIHQCFIASFDLGNESYQEILLPDFDKVDLNLSVFKDCLCIMAGADIWIMKEYGNKESWIKLFTIPYLWNSFTPSSSSHFYLRAIYVFDDDQVLLKSIKDPSHTYIFYNSKNDTSKFVRFDNILEVCIESLISPCF